MSTGNVLHTASNNHKVVQEVGFLQVEHPSLVEPTTINYCTLKALVEYVEKRRGYWHYGTEPGFLVMPVTKQDHSDGRCVRVLKLASGTSNFFWERLVSDPTRYSGQEEVGAARAYFEKHPKPKPWEQAQIDEVWELDFIASDGQSYVADTALVCAHPKKDRTVFQTTSGWRLRLDDAGISDGKLLSLGEG